MPKRGWIQLLLTMTVAVCLLVLPGARSAQGALGHAFHRVRDVQERHTARLMRRAGIVGTATGRNEQGHNAVVILLERTGVSGIPRELEGVPVRTIVTGKIYALAPAPVLAQFRWPWWSRRDRTPPATPTGVKASADGSSRINLDWADNGESDLSYYRLYRATTSGGPYSRLVTIPTSAYSDSGLAPSTTYYYIVTAIDTAGNQSSYSDQANATTAANAPAGPWPKGSAAIGLSTGHFNVTAGTIGCRVVKNGKRYVLSNNHIYADENRASIGDNVLQPGPYDGGVSPDDAIGTLAEFESIVFSRFARNTIDAAIAEIIVDTVDGQAVPRVDNATPDDGYGVPASTPAEATLELPVQKYGRTSGLTEGTIMAVNATVNVTYDRGTARFVGQIVITPGDFTAAGDSGALVVTQDGNNPVGLVFAGSDSYTIANPIDLVLDRLGVAIDGK